MKKAKADKFLMLFIMVDLDEQVVTKGTKKDRNEVSGCNAKDGITGNLVFTAIPSFFGVSVKKNAVFFHPCPTFDSVASSGSNPQTVFPWM